MLKELTQNAKERGEQNERQYRCFKSSECRCDPAGGAKDTLKAIT